MARLFNAEVPHSEQYNGANWWKCSRPSHAPRFKTLLKAITEN